MDPLGQGVVVEGRRRAALGLTQTPRLLRIHTKAKGIEGFGWLALPVPWGRPPPEGTAGVFSFAPPSQPRRIAVFTVPRTRTWALMPTKAAAATMRLKVRMV